MPALNGRSINLQLQNFTASSASIQILSGAATGPITITNIAGSATTVTPFTVTPSSTFTISAAPATASLIQGQTVAYAVQLNSADGFNQLAPLSVTGLPTGVTAAFKPASINAGQTSLLTLTAPANQPVSTATLSVSATATVSGIALTQSASAALAITAPTTSFVGRTVGADSLETPLAGVTVTMLGLNGGGSTTDCSGNTVSDAAGNFALTNLPAGCIGPQLVGFGGTKVTSPPGNYAGVNLVFTLVAGQVVVSPILIHLPKIDGVETFMVQQNASSDQSHVFTSIPGLSMTVYAGTTFTLPDGTQPNPFPLAAVQIAIDRLPDVMPLTTASVTAFVVAFQPANTTASQPAPVYFPNTLNTPPGTDMPLMTLNPTLGRMAPYGTGTVSPDGTQIIPDIDPSTGTLLHRFGIVHFDWDSPAPPAEPPGRTNPNPTPNPTPTPPPGGCGGASTTGQGGTMCSMGSGPTTGEPIDLTSGLHVIRATDISIKGTRGPISVQRIYRGLTTNDGPFGLGSQTQYGWQLDTGSPNSATAINLISPDNNYFLFSGQPGSALRNSSTPWLQGAVMTTNASGVTNLRFRDGTVYQFTAVGNVGYLNSISDRNGNTITLTVIAMSRNNILRLTQVTDPVGRSLNLTYDANFHCTTVTDPTGRTVNYTYNASGTLATVTDPNGGVTQYTYDAQNRITSMIDPRGVTAFEDTYL
jgi:YD repeat-containing protein